MKIKLTITILAALAITPFSAQDYHPLLESNKTWLEASYLGANICLYDQVYQLRIGEDTLINDHTYHKVIRRNHNAEGGSPFCPPFIPQMTEELMSHVFLRENVEERKVYLWVNEAGNNQFEEVVLYDFNLEVGDTIPISSYLTDQQVFTVTSVDEVTLLNGDIRQRITYSNGAGESSYIQGLGGDKGLFQPFFDGIGFWNESLCIQQDEVHLFVGYGGQMACDWILSSEQTYEGQSRLYPNPAADRITFELAPQALIHGNMSFVLHSLDGRKVFFTNITGTVNQFQPNAVSGMYIWQLQINGNVMDTGKLVIESRGN